MGDIVVFCLACMSRKLVDHFEHSCMRWVGDVWMEIMGVEVVWVATWMLPERSTWCNSTLYVAGRAMIKKHAVPSTPEAYISLVRKC